MDIKSDKFIEFITKGISVIDFYAEWCGPCKMMSPIVEEVANEMVGKANIGKINVDEEMDLAGKYGVSSIPTLIYFKDGQEVDRTLGVQSKEAIIKKIDSLL